MNFHLLEKTPISITFCTPYNPKHVNMVHEHVVYRVERYGKEWQLFILCYDGSFEYRAQPIALTNEVKDWLDSL